MSHASIQSESSNSLAFAAARADLDAVARKISTLKDWARDLTPANGRLYPDIDEAVQKLMDQFSMEQSRVYEKLMAARASCVEDAAVKARALMELLPDEIDCDVAALVARSLAEDVVELASRIQKQCEAA